ncbi:MAG TPA: AbrB/MazE/SpoVT family DNA-binding domain-containing protein [Thermoanaerobaculia bacterium]
MAVSTLTSKGQITIPKAVRERLGLKAGDRLEVLLDDRGKLVIYRSASPLARPLAGLLHHLAPKRPVSIAEMKKAVRQRTRKKFGGAG